jgi:hypothetical protein
LGTGGGASLLTPTAVKSNGSYAAAVGDLVVVDLSRGPFAITLPTGPSDKAQVGWKIVKVNSPAVTANVLTISCGGSDLFDVAGGTAMATPPSVLNLEKTYQYQKSAGLYLGVGSDVSVSQLDTRYTLPGASGPGQLPQTVLSVASAYAASEIPADVRLEAAATGQVPVKNADGGWAPVTVAPVDVSDAPQPLGVANPGQGLNGASPSDHIHGMPATSQLSDVQGTLTNGQAWVWNATAGKLQPGSIPVTYQSIWMGASNGEITLPRGHVDDSGSYSQTPATKVLHLQYFVAQRATVVGHVEFATGGTAGSASTLTQVGLFTVNTSTGALTLVASSASPGATLGSYAQPSLALTAAYTLTAGVTYVVGLLQVATTPASIMGQYAVGEYFGESPLLCQELSGQSTMPASITSGASSAGWAVFYFLTA